LDGKSRWLLRLLLLLLFLSLYLPFRSRSLDDFDSYSFALALDHFSLELQQPQPPGFPVYVYLGRLLCEATGDKTGALTLLSVLSGVAIVLLVFELGLALRDRRPSIGTCASLLVGLTPMAWLTAEKALSDAPGLALTLLALWLLWRGHDDLRWLGAGSFACGLAMGLRPQGAVPAALLLGGLTLFWVVRRRSIAAVGWAVIPFALAVALWLLPTTGTVGGLSVYLTHVREHAARVRQTDSLLGTGMPFLLALRARALEFAETFFTHTAGFSVLGSWSPADVVRCVLFAGITVPGLAGAGWRRRETWLLALWAVLAGGQLLLFETLDRPRLILPLLPPLALLISMGWARLARWGMVRPAAITTAAFALLLHGYPIAAELSSVRAPQAQATDFVRANYSPDEVLLAAAGSYRAAQVELPGHSLLYLYMFDADAAWAATTVDQVRYVVIFDRDAFPDDAMLALSGDQAYVPIVDTTFTRSSLAHTQNADLRLQVLTPSDRIPAQALAPPAGGCIDIGAEGDGRYLLRGWYRREDVGGVSGRWAGGTPTTTVRIYLARAGDYDLSVRAVSYPAGQELTVCLGGRELGQVSLEQSWEEHSFTLPAELIRPGEVMQIELIHSRAASPYTETGGETTDRRELSAAYDWICLEGVGAGP
jgi:4-amino-4-deoxy-L-arabinose transferase-like glycosyltransferase